MISLKIEWLLFISLLVIVYISQNIPTTQEIKEEFAGYPDPSHKPYKLNEFQCYKAQHSDKKVDFTKLYSLNEVFGDPRNQETQNTGTLKPPSEFDCHGYPAFQSPDTDNLYRLNQPKSFPQQEEE